MLIILLDIRKEDVSRQYARGVCNDVFQEFERWNRAYFPDINAYEEYADEVWCYESFMYVWSSCGYWQGKREYRNFKKKLILEGFVMLQYSVYIRTCPNRQYSERLQKRLAKNLPANGNIRLLEITENNTKIWRYL